MSVFDASYRCQDPPVILGPERFPCFPLYSPILHEPLESLCICNLVDYTLDNGLGAVINPGPSAASWVIRSAGMLPHRMFLAFEVSEEQKQRSPLEEVVVKKNQGVMLGEPSEAFLPPEARAEIKRGFAERYGINDLSFFERYR